MDGKKLLEQHKKRMARIALENQELAYREEEAAARNTQKRKISGSKLIMFAMIALCLEIVIFAEWLMVHFADTSALYVLIGIPASLTVSFWAYASKAKKENCESGIIYETAMLEKKAELGLLDKYDEDENNAVG